MIPSPLLTHLLRTIIGVDINLYIVYNIYSVLLIGGKKWPVARKREKRNDSK